MRLATGVSRTGFGTAGLAAILLGPLLCAALPRLADPNALPFDWPRDAALVTTAPLTATALLLLGFASVAILFRLHRWRLSAAASSSIAFALFLAARLAPIDQAGGVFLAAIPPSLLLGTAALLLLCLGQTLLLLDRPRLARPLLLIAAALFLVHLPKGMAGLPELGHGVALLLGIGGLCLTISLLLAATGKRHGRDQPTILPSPGRFTQGLLMGSSVAIPLLGWGLGYLSGHDGNAVLVSEALLALAWTVIVITRPAAAPSPIATLAWARGTDRLTGLYNRNTMDGLIAILAEAPARAAIVMIDLDRFRSANHTLGHQDADAVLQEVARRLVAIARGQDIVRTGGDEFAIFCRDIGSAEAIGLAERLLAAIGRPFDISAGRSFHVTASIGLAHGQTEGLNDLRDAADEALYFAKQQGGNQAVLFTPPLHRVQIERAGLEQDLHRAFRSDSELFLVYQPIISLRDNSLVAIEALARWQHPQAGLVPPGRFVGIAEAAGMGLGLGAKIREMAVAQVAAWRDRGMAPLPVVNLNVSPQELSRADVPAALSALVDRYGLDRAGFCIEVTEGTFTDGHALSTLRAAREAGFKIAMDDFGTGYSSLAQLPRLPLTSLKLDRSFLDQAMASEDGISLFATIVQLAHVLNLPVVAEGVETPEELAVASDCGCDFVQGFFFARPLSAAQFETSLEISPGATRLSWLKRQPV